MKAAKIAWPKQEEGGDGLDIDDLESIAVSLMDQVSPHPLSHRKRGREEGSVC